MLAALLLVPVAYAQAPTAVSEVEQASNQPGAYYARQPQTESLDLHMYERIRTEGMTHGHAMDFGSALCGRNRPAPDRLTEHEESERVDARHADQDRPCECASGRLG